MKRVFFKNYELLVYDSVYEPHEDSFLLAETVKVSPGIKALDMGCGCGIQAINLALQGAEVLAADINEKALENTLENAKRLGLGDKIEVRKSNLFSSLSDQKFDCIVFNPPYLPKSDLKDISIEGGLKGFELLHEFLEELPKHLVNNGCCFFVQSSITNERKTKRKLKQLALSYEIAARARFFFEELIVFKVFL